MTGHLTRKERARVLQYVRYLQVEFNLQGWDIVVQREPSDPDTHAHTQRWNGRRMFNLAIGSDWATLTRATKTHVLIHELGHILVGSYRAAILRHADLTPRGIDEVADQEEQVVEALAQILRERVDPYPGPRMPDTATVHDGAL